LKSQFEQHNFVAHRTLHLNIPKNTQIIVDLSPRIPHSLRPVPVRPENLKRKMCFCFFFYFFSFLLEFLNGSETQKNIQITLGLSLKNSAFPSSSTRKVREFETKKWQISLEFCPIFWKIPKKIGKFSQNPITQQNPKFSLRFLVFTVFCASLCTI